MRARPRDFLLCATLAAATPALGQTAAPPVPPAAGIRSRSGQKQVALTQRRGQLPAAGRRLLQPNLEAARGRNREEAWRDFVGGRGLSDAKQPVLASGGALYLLGFLDGDGAE